MKKAEIPPLSPSAVAKNVKQGRAVVAVAGILAAALVGCSLAPTLKTPQIASGEAYKEIGTPWTQAAPADRLPRDSWWTLYGDAELDDLQHRLIAGSPDLAAALANYQQAQAYSDFTRGDLFPQVGANASVQRTQLSKDVANVSPAQLYNTRTVGFSASYELDFWGRVRNEVAAGKAQAEAAADDLENARLSLIGQLVDSYVMLRGLDRDSAILTDTVKAYQRALDLTNERHRGGIAPGLDVARAQTQLDTARAQAEQTLAQRALVEHSIAALIGVSPSQFSIAAKIVDIKLPAVPVDVPSTLLQRRPDIAAAQRRMEAANANIGVARAAFFPSISLGANGGYMSSQAGNWLTQPSSFWAIGPAALLTLFDGGKRSASVAQARAVFDESSAKYRSTVLGAFTQVEDNLALLNHYRDAAVAEKSAVEAAQRSLNFSLDRYREGAVNYLDVVTSQTAALQTQRDALSLDTSELRASVALIRALGGGWEQAEATAEKRNLDADKHG
jgi:NodT family efflux transporter outer membrane factor (OMF) lipoprotein